VPVGCPGKCGCSQLTVRWTGPAPLTQKLTAPESMAGVSCALSPQKEQYVGCAGVILSHGPTPTTTPLQPLLCRWLE
jgi:hypothetical protein